MPELTDPQAALTQSMTAAGLNLIAQALSIYDADLKLAVCNAPFKNMFDLPDRFVTPGASFEDTIRYLAEIGDYGEIEDIDAFIKVRTEQASAFEPHYVERTRANGRTISVEGSPLPQGGWVTVYTDITQTKRSEQMLRARSEELSGQLLAHTEELSATNRALAATVTALEQAKRDLTEAEARTRLTTEMMPAHIAHVGPDGVYTFTNRKLSSVMPGRPNDLVGSHISDALGDETYRRILPSLTKAHDGENSVFEFTDSITSRRIRVAFTSDDQGGAYIMSMDMTAEKQARDALQQTRRRTLAAQFTNGLAHDFSNLLTIILGMQGKLQRMELDDNALTLVDGTMTAAARGGTLLGRIADMTGQPTLRPTSTDLSALLDDIKALATPTLPDGITLTVQDDTPSVNVLLDAGMLQDALLNLVLNARDACGQNGQIKLHATLANDIWIEFTVTDTGPGFSTDALSRGLEPFFTTKGNEGSGLGLSMVYDMAKLTGGDLKLANSGNGATVTLRVPWRSAPTGVSGLVMLVEDDDTLRANTRDMLTDLGHAVIEATSVDEATKVLADVPDIGLVLSDIKLEGTGTGLDLIKRIGPKGPAQILMTSLPVSDPLHQEALSSAPVLPKPFSAADLGALLSPKAKQ